MSGVKDFAAAVLLLHLTQIAARIVQGKPGLGEDPERKQRHQNATVKKIHITTLPQTEE